MSRKLFLFSAFALCGLLILCIGIMLFADDGLVETRGVVTAYNYEALASRKKAVTVEYRDSANRTHVITQGGLWYFSRICHPILAVKGVGTTMTVAYPPDAPANGRIRLWEKEIFENVHGKFLLIVMFSFTVYSMVKRWFVKR